MLANFLAVSRWRKIWWSGPVTLTFDLWPWNARFMRLSRYMLMQNLIKLSIALHRREFSWVQRKKNEHNTVRRYRAESKNMWIILEQCFQRSAILNQLNQHSALTVMVCLGLRRILRWNLYVDSLSPATCFSCQFPIATSYTPHHEPLSAQRL